MNVDEASVAVSALFSLEVISMAKSDSEGELNETTRNEIGQGRREIRAGRGMTTRELVNDQRINSLACSTHLRSNRLVDRAAR